MKKYNYIVAAVLLVVGIGMIVGTMDFPYHGLSDIGGGFWPKLLGGALLLCSIGLALETALKKQPDEVTIDFRSEGMKRVLIALGIMGGNPKFCVTAKSGANREKFIMGGRRVKRLPPC